MISYKNKVIFIHQPKTAGTTITEAFGQPRHHIWWRAHAGWRIYQRCFPDLWESFHKITVKREEEDHRRSWFNHFKAQLTETWQVELLHPYEGTYEDWVARGCPVAGDWSLAGCIGSPLDFNNYWTRGVRVLRFGHLDHDWREFVEDCKLDVDPNYISENNRKPATHLL